MRRRILLGIILSLTAATSDAALVSRLSGQAYYDTVLNITWVADANLSQTSGYSPDGYMLWTAAKTWIDALNSGNHLGVNDWRLPNADVNADVTIVDCSTATELSCRDDELGYMYWQNLATSASPSPFTNLQPADYWSGTEWAEDPLDAWELDFNNGELVVTDVGNAYAWAVRSGDIASVPVPAALWLLGSALGVIGVMRRRALHN